MKLKILILSDFYLPGYKSGGAVRTLVSMVERMSDEFDFAVITRNHDGWGDFTPYPDVKIGEWNSIGNTPVYYFGTDGISGKTIKQQWAKVEPNAIFAVSFFSSLTTKVLTMRRLGQLPKTPFILAPQGELSPGALQIKAAKKRGFITLTKNFGIYSNIIWKASGDEEKADIERVLNKPKLMRVVPDLTPQIIYPEHSFEQKPAKTAGELRLIFLSRVNRKKNLSHALRALQSVSGTVVFDVFGAHDDEIYWQECQELIKLLPTNIKVTVHGSIDYRDVLETMSRYHYFILPTLSENFGHVILEALATGCGVILSDNTPWRDLSEKEIGWDLPLGDLNAWEKVLQNCIDQNQEQFQQISIQARQFTLDWLAAPEVEAANRQILRDAVSKKTVKTS